MNKSISIILAVIFAATVISALSLRVKDNSPYACEMCGLFYQGMLGEVQMGLPAEVVCMGMVGMCEVGEFWPVPWNSSMASECESFNTHYCMKMSEIMNKNGSITSDQLCGADLQVCPEYKYPLVY
ncbi:hypothetical protein PPL_01248 [Heterostelium album PN500]|uniref:Saposin B-type domain-containing protein n=1 Tax=Heterostelium pallidum (strain ATCC 26659 / Pp 5 / PN500) TaxID=670386 RepID=D3AYI8_HETP5|nr:hypothetical protein PPL_01248 [Heterostelium album PN500]EFA86015.1 hypothetical protein PPL_01248 [Heterostelium album PN500]|eukprot:XP_020438121.1 hypothetical protein PPL_01248 [Heterostelium album PN500]